MNSRSEKAVSKARRELGIAGVDEGVFAAAERMLRGRKDAVDIAACAEALAGRLPGGALYRARLWTAVADIIAPQGFQNGSREAFRAVCSAVRVEPNIARQLVAEGRVIKELEARRLKLDGLRFVPPEVLTSALAQRSRATDYLKFANRQYRKAPHLAARALHKRWTEQHGSIRAKLDIIKPSDWWAFSHPKWRQDRGFPGSIPGEVYANALYYFAPRNGVAVDAMAGSGMFRRVYRDRRLWQKDSDFQLTIGLYDLHPYRPGIRRHDARKPLPEKADWIFIDPPYYGQSDHLYQGDLAEVQTYDAYLAQLKLVIRSMAKSLKKGGRFCLLLPKWSGRKADDRNHDMPRDAAEAAASNGLEWLDAAFVSRGRQQERGFGYQNLAAKRRRRMVSDTCVLNVFEAES
jgi:hypothetical protein